MEPFLTHLETIQRAAQLSANSNESAESTVEETYRRAIAAGRAGDRRTPLQLLLAALRDTREAWPTSEDEASTVAEQTVAQTRLSAAMEQVKTVLYEVLTRLDSQDWSLLFLSEIDSLGDEELASLIGDSPEGVTQRMESLHTEIHEHLFADARPAERLSLIETLPDDWLRTALTEISSDFQQPSEGLRARIAASAGPQGRTETLPRPAAAPDVPKRETGPRRTKRTFRPLSILVGIALVLVVGFGADYLHSMLSEAPEDDLVALVARNAKRFKLDLQTSSVDQGERFLHTHSGLRPGIPEIDGASLEGVGMEQIAPGVSAPVARYVDDESKSRITVYVLSYRFLDANPNVTLSSDVRRQIQSASNFDLHSLSSGDVLIWRAGPGIYLAVSSLDGRALQPRIRPRPAQD